MIDAHTYALLADIVQRESRSLLQYVNDSFPWITPEERNLLTQIRTMSEEEKRGVADLLRFLQRSHQPPPYVGNYSATFTSLSFVSLDHLIPLLATHERDDLRRLERGFGSISDPEAKEVLQKIVEKKRRHLDSLQSLAANRSQPAVA